MKEVLNFILGDDHFTVAHHNKEITIKGNIGIAKQVTPELVTAVFKCNRCGEIIQVAQGGGKCKLLLPEDCSNPDCNLKRPRFTFLQDRSTFTSYQEIWLKPIDNVSPKFKLGPGQKVVLKEGLVGAKEGENILVTGKLGFELKGRTNFAIPIVIATKIKRLK